MSQPSALLWYVALPGAAFALWLFWVQHSGDGVLLMTGGGLFACWCIALGTWTGASALLQTVAALLTLVGVRVALYGYALVWLSHG